MSYPEWAFLDIQSQYEPTTLRPRLACLKLTWDRSLQIWGYTQGYCPCSGEQKLNDMDTETELGKDYNVYAILLLGFPLNLEEGKRKLWMATENHGNVAEGSEREVRGVV